MRFTVAGSKIHCSRLDNTVEEGDCYRRVVECDAQVDSVPPHVESRLTVAEVRQFEEFLEDRKRIQANPAEQNMIEAVPELLREATAILESVEQLNKSMYGKLSAAVGMLQLALEDVRPGD